MGQAEAVLPNAQEEEVGDHELQAGRLGQLLSEPTQYIDASLLPQAIPGGLRKPFTDFGVAHGDDPAYWERDTVRPATLNTAPNCPSCTNISSS